MDRASRLSADQLEKYGYRKSRIIDHNLDHASLETRCPLDNGRHTGRWKHRAGRLDRLPLELITQVLLSLDLPSLTTFRRVNRRAMALVDSLRQYSMLFRHCPNILRAILSMEAKHFDCAFLFQTVSTTKCASCDRVGDHLYLITCKRVCYDCYSSDPLYFPASATLVTRKTGVPRKSLKALPHVRSLPGRYTAFDKIARGRVMLLDRQSLRDRTTTTGSSAQTLDEALEQCDLKTTEPRRYMSIISAPFFDSSGLSADWGFYCLLCLDDTEPSTYFRNKYTEDGFAEHLARYGLNHGLQRSRE
ncbi:hypothetical protein DCS_02780 [Drechmeria coniospora]|uniref:F-box domain-containing protein n=1 Tax=Drechmeria coniospora TaxID=98403 RepID=A0A151GX07_DRECN|nr:hypothetical protein DCS_02780 [Drechmeria coniospora]KYK61637.1 hypothetical protein DCS_02780 [Drechmeria coniospora]ODA82431.1 hypothetical protein RJ55_00938 [Drechmeria coniospora]